MSPRHLFSGHTVRCPVCNGMKMKPVSIEVFRGAIRTRFHGGGITHGARPAPEDAYLQELAKITHKNIELRVVFTCSGGREQHTSELRLSSPQQSRETFAWVEARATTDSAVPLLPIQARKPLVH